MSVNLTENPLAPLVYESGVASRLLFINYVSQPGVSDYTVQFAVGGQQTGQESKTPLSVRVKYLLADSVSQKFNITW